MTTWLTLLLIAALFAILLLLIMFRGFFFSSEPSPPTDMDIPEKKGIPCILCGTKLERGERLYSEEFKYENDSIIHIRGCPYCTGKKDEKKRNCPVCGRELEYDEYLIGRMWTRKNGKRHLHINRCTRCG